MMPHSPRKYDAFDISSEASQLRNGVAVGNSDHILFNDGAFIQRLSHVVAGCTDEFDAAIISLMVRFRAREGR